MKIIDEILDREMDRREFFKLAGASILAVIGVTGLLNNLSILAARKNETQQTGYGSSPYGR